MEPGEQHAEVQLGIKFCSDYFIYSSKGEWGIVVSSGHYGLLGGSPEFIEEICANIPGLNEQVYSFLQYWQCEKKYAMNDRKKFEIDWLPVLLKHIYGQTIAEKMLQKQDYPKI